MNKDTFQGNWKMLKGKLKEKWGKLTDDDIKRIEGKREQLYGLLEQRYGLSREKCEKQLSEFLDNFDRQNFESHWNEIRNRIREKFNTLSNEDIARIKGKRDELVKMLQDKYHVSREQAAERLQEFVDSLHLEEAGAGSSGSPGSKGEQRRM